MAIRGSAPNPGVYPLEDTGEVWKAANYSAALHRISCSCVGLLSSVALFRCNFSIGTFFGIIRVYTVLFSDLTDEVCQPKKYRGEHYSISSSAFLILTARYSLVGRSILKRPSKLPTFSTVMFHVSIMSTVYILLSSI